MIFNELDFLVFIAAHALAAISPGPGIAALVATVLAGGSRRAIWFCLGIIAGDLTWLILSLSGLAFIAQQVPIVFEVIKWLGVIYLAYLAFKAWGAPSATLQSDVHQASNSKVSRILSGYLITMGNPKTMLFYLALLPSLMHVEEFSITMIFSLCLAVIIVLSVVFSVYMFAAEKARHIMSSKQSVPKFNRITATALGGAALWIAMR